MRVFHQSYVRLCLLPPLFFSETTLITIGSEGINSRSPVLLSDMITSGNLASFQLFPRASPQPLRDLLYRSFFLVGKCFIAMCIVATGTSTSSHLTQEYPVPTHVTREVRPNPPRFAVCRVWMWREQTQDRSSRCTHTYTCKNWQMCTSSQKFP